LTWQAALDNALLELQRRYGGEIIKTGNEIIAERRFEDYDISDGGQNG